jgi:hypothetical protein
MRPPQNAIFQSGASPQARCRGRDAPITEDPLHVVESKQGMKQTKLNDQHKGIPSLAELSCAETTPATTRVSTITIRLF